MNLACQAGATRAGDAVLIVPAFVKELAEAQYRCRSDKAPNLTIGQWLRAQPDRVQQRERKRLLQKFGLVSF